MLIYDKSGRELCHRLLLSLFVVEIWPSEGPTLLCFLVWSISPQQKKIIQFCGIILLHFYHRSTYQTNSLSISKCRRRYILTNTWWKTKTLSSSGQIFFQLHSMSLKCQFLESWWKDNFSDISVFLLSFCCFFFLYSHLKVVAKAQFWWNPPPPPPNRTSDNQKLSLSGLWSLRNS